MNLSFGCNNLSNSPPRKKKGVKFADEEEVHDVLRRRSQISRESMHGIWFDGEDFESFIEDMEKSIKRLEKGKVLKDKKYSSLGLECQTQEGSALRQCQKEYAWDMVLWEQEQQQKEGRRSSMQLAEAYREASRDAEVRAVKSARQVSDEALEDYTKSGLLNRLEEEGSSSTFMSLSDVDGPEVHTELPRTKPVRVRFAEEPVVHTVIRRRSQISRQSLEGIWFGCEDFEAFMDEVEESVDKMEHGEQLQEKEETSLGLEALTEEANDQRHKNQEDAWDTVLGEQDDQQREGVTSPFQIARAYRKVSSDAIMNAIAQARKVSEEVQEDKCADDEKDLLLK
ncbi:unnamed protein product [Cylindrotheca closterium]|uniref:Uncharacterized protein n=1 Tax=Cylindrotheca closterium TaxID=2856 RepID=A0AAD2JH23_9STRA|nr:unnamed protein product [Cylindrotheca closterium]